MAGEFVARLKTKFFDAPRQGDRSRRDACPMPRTPVLTFQLLMGAFRAGAFLSWALSRRTRTRLCLLQRQMREKRAAFFGDEFWK